MSQPLVTVVTPTFNPGWRLRRCLDSVESQTYPHIEHLVMDGASTDGTLDVLAAARASWQSAPDEGQSDALNQGFARARGAVLTWLNADDVLTPQAIAAAVERLAAGDVGWVYGDVRIEAPEASRLLVPPSRIQVRDFRLTNPLSQPGTFFTKSAFELVGPLDVSLHYAMDLDLWLRLLTRGVPGAHMGTLVAVFEVHADSKGGSVPLSEFLVEAARACWRQGCRTYAAAYAGRAAAHRDDAEAAPSWPGTERQLRRLLADPELSQVDRRAAARNARAQSALLAARGRRARGAAGTLHPAVWSDELSRALVIHAAGTAVKRSLPRRFTGSISAA